MKGEEIMEGFLTYDPATKKHTRWTFLFASPGPMVESTAGWEGDKLVFTGEGVHLGHKMSVRDVYAKKSASEYTLSVEVGEPGKMHVAFDETCKKTAEKPAPKKL